MKFSVRPTGEAEQEVADKILELLQNGSVTWFVSGGSAIASQAAILQTILQHDTGGTLQRKLTILPVDERYGPYDHADSNSAQLRSVGFEPGAAQWHDVLEHGSSLEGVRHVYAELVERSLVQDTLVATLGMGADGHTAGILPDSPALADTQEPVIAYPWTDYTRLTTSLRVLRQLQAAYVLAYGDAKHDALLKLQSRQDDLSAVPALVLYDVPSVTVYNSFIESEGDQ